MVIPAPPPGWPYWSACQLTLDMITGSDPVTLSIPCGVTGSLIGAVAVFESKAVVDEPHKMVADSVHACAVAVLVHYGCDERRRRWPDPVQRFEDVLALQAGDAPAVPTLIADMAALKLGCDKVRLHLKLVDPILKRPKHGFERVGWLTCKKVADALRGGHFTQASSPFGGHRWFVWLWSHRATTSVHFGALALRGLLRTLAERLGICRFWRRFERRLDRVLERQFDLQLAGALT